MTAPRAPLWPSYLAVLVATLVWGTLHPIGKLALQEATPLQLLLARTVLTGLTLWLLMAGLGRLGRIGEEFRTRPLRIVGLGLLSFGASSGLSMLGLGYLPASINSLMANTSPLMLALGLVAIERRPPAGRVALGLLLGFAGVALLALGGAASLGAFGLLGVLLSLGGSATWAVYTGWSRRELSRGDPIAITAAGSFVGALPFVLVGLWSGDVAALGSLGRGTLLQLLYAGVVGTALTYALWMTGLRRLSATSVSAFQYVIPLNAVVLSVLLLGEPLTPQLVLGGAAILAGVALAQERLTTASGRG
jgi:drug/metabolite transporter (DMT)-like permease